MIETLTTLAQPQAEQTIMSREEMETRFSGEWVLMTDPYVSSQTYRVESGAVVWHGTSRDEVWRQADLLPRHSHIGVFYFSPELYKGRYCL